MSLSVRITFRDGGGTYSCYADEAQIDADIHVLPDGSRERVFDAYLVNVFRDGQRFPTMRVRNLAHVAVHQRRMLDVAVPFGSRERALDECQDEL